MTVGIIVAIIAAIVITAVAAAVMARRRGGRGAAAEVRRLDLRPLSPPAREYYAENWTHVQGSFVDAPGMALESADSLVSRLLQDIGYPTDDEQRLLRLLSVEHAPAVPAYREARAVNEKRSAGVKDVDTESMRVAVNGYDALFQDLMANHSGPSDATAALHRTEVA
jgi:hypothetical protein